MTEFNENTYVYTDRHNSMTTDRLKIIGLYVPNSLSDRLVQFLYDRSGVIDPYSYYNVKQGSTPKEDPFGKITKLLVNQIVSNYNSLCYESDFAKLESVQSESFTVLRVASYPDKVYQMRDLVERTSESRELDKRTIHGALLTTLFREGYHKEITSKVA